MPKSENAQETNTECTGYLTESPHIHPITLCSEIQKSVQVSTNIFTKDSRTALQPIAWNTPKPAEITHKFLACSSE